MTAPGDRHLTPGLESRVSSLELRQDAHRDRLIALELAARYEREVPKKPAFPWSTVLYGVFLLAYAVFQYLTQPGG